jgi:hypothetical protein
MLYHGRQIRLWEWSAYIAIKRGRNSPDASIAVRSLFYLIEFVLFDAIRWVGDNSMKTVFWNAPQPFKTIGMDNTTFLSPTPFYRSIASYGTMRVSSHH